MHCSRSAFLPGILPLPRRPPPSRRSPFRCTALPPRRIASVAKDLRQALQQSLEARNSRASLKLPEGAKLGTEARADTETAVERRRSGDRELARVVVGMFEGTGLGVTVVFGSEGERERAQRVWGEGEWRTEVWGGKKGAKGARKGRKGGFGVESTERGKEGADGEVYVVVGGGAALLSKVRAFSKSVGMETLVIALNPNSDDDRLPIDLDVEWNDTFVPVYHFEPNPHPRWSGGVLFRKFPDDWVLCRLSALRILQKLLVGPDRPTLDDIGAALAQEQDKPGNPLLNKITTFMDRGT